MHSLRGQILIASLALSTIALLAVALFSTRASTAIFEEVQTSADRSAPHALRPGTIARIAEEVHPSYDRGDARQTDDLLMRLRPVSYDLAITDNAGSIVASSSVLLTGASVLQAGARLTIEKNQAQNGTRDASQLRIELPRAAIAQRQLGGKRPGTLLAIPRPRHAVSTNAAIANTLNRKIWIAALLAVLVGVLLSVLLSGYIVTPLNSMTHAVTRMAAQDFDARVPLQGPSELLLLAAAFNEMAQRLKTAEETRRELLSDVAHELRTPINNLQGQFEALADGLTQATPARLASLQEDVLRLGAMVSDLQYLNLADAGQLELQLQPLPPCEFLRATLRGIDGLALAKRIVVDTQCDPALPMMQADPEKLRHVLINVLSNAVRYTPLGGKIAVEAAVIEHMVCFKISDEGPGFPDGQATRVFERFYRADGSRSRDTGGSGLGLAIAKRFVEAHGGTINAQNNIAGGAEITFGVPLYKGA